MIRVCALNNCLRHSTIYVCAKSTYFSGGYQSKHTNLDTFAIYIYLYNLILLYSASSFGHGLMWSAKRPSESLAAGKCLSIWRTSYARNRSMKVFGRTTRRTIIINISTIGTLAAKRYVNCVNMCFFLVCKNST